MDSPPSYEEIPSVNALQAEANKTIPSLPASQNSSVPVSTTGEKTVPSTPAPAKTIPPIVNTKPSPPSNINEPLMVEDIIRIIEKQGVISIEELAKPCGWKVPDLEKVLKLLEEKGVVKLDYPASILQGPKVSIERKLDEKVLGQPDGEVIEKYTFSIDGVMASVQIIQVTEDRRPFYYLYIQTFGPYTMSVLEELHDKVAARIPIDTIDLADVEQANALKQQFLTIAKSELKTVFTSFSEPILNALAGHMLHKLYGLGELELMMGDNNLEEIAINSSKTPITVYHRQYGWMKSNLIMPNEEEIQNLSAQIARKNGREITNLHPILDAHLLTGDRVNATLFPISSTGNTITIRRFSRTPWTIIDFIGKEKTMSVEMAAWLWIAMQYELSILVAGSTASGKTSALNALAAFIPSHQRVITIEDVRELNLPDYMQWNWIPLTTRNPNPEGAGEVSMLDLLISSLRMRPDRLIVGEIRTKDEAETLFEAVHTGHSVYATIHADSGKQVIRRLTEPPISVPPLEVESIDLIIVQFRDRRTNERKTLEVAEVESGTGSESLSTQDIFRWMAREDVFEKINPPVRLIQKLNTHTGMTQREIEDEVVERIHILEWMLTHELHTMKQVGDVMRLFYANPTKIKEAARANTDPSLILKTSMMAEKNTRTPTPENKPPARL